MNGESRVKGEESLSYSMYAKQWIVFAFKVNQDAKVGSTLLNSKEELITSLYIAVSHMHPWCLRVSGSI